MIIKTFWMIQGCKNNGRLFGQSVSSILFENRFKFQRSTKLVLQQLFSNEIRANFIYITLYFLRTLKGIKLGSRLLVQTCCAICMKERRFSVFSVET